MPDIVELPRLNMLNDAICQLLWGYFVSICQVGIPGHAGDDELQFVLYIADDLTVEEVHDPLCA